MRLLGTLSPVNAGYSALWGYLAPDGREYAILGGTLGTYFIDVTDSTNIHQVGFVSSVSSGWREMKTYSHYAYIVSEGDTTGVQIVDLANLPASIRYVGKYSAPGHKTTHSISQSGPYLYLNGANVSFGHGIVVLDLSVNPEQPVLRGKWNDFYVHDCRVVNDTIWACNINDSKVSAINALNKDNLTTITNWVNGQNPVPHNCALTTGRRYIYVTDESFTPPGRLKIWNIQNLSDIILERVWLPEPFFQGSVIHNVELYGNQLLAAYYSAGVKLLDVSSPTNPVELGWYDTKPEDNGERQGCWAVYMFPSGKIIASDMQKGLFVLRYAPPQNTKPQADFMTDKRLYYSGDSVQFIDCSFNNPTSYQWTITGPQSFSSAQKNPKIPITALGDYTVKLKVTNSFGADSLTKTAYVKINGSPLSGYTFYGDILRTIFTNRNDTSKVTFTWGSANRSGNYISYKFRIRKNGTTVEYYYPSANNGLDTSITFTKSRLDSIAKQLGLSGDSVVTICKATAYNGVDSLASANSLLVTFKPTSVGIQNISSQIPDRFLLENNFPNPFNPSTNIKFQLPEKSFVRLIIYDMLGREVETLLNENMNAGFYSFAFNAVNLNSGIYFYKLEAGDFKETKKMILVK